MPSWSSAAPTSSVRMPSSTNDSTPAFSAARADHAAGPGRVASALGRVDEQLVLVARDVLEADRADVVERRAEPDGIGDVAGAGLEAHGGGW